MRVWISSLALILLSCAPAGAQLQSGIFFDVDSSIGGRPLGLAVYEGHAYVAATTALNVYDLTDPDQPVLVQSRSYYESSTPDARILDVCIEPSSGILYLASGQAGLRIYSIHEPTSLILSGSRPSSSSVNFCRIRDGHLLVGTDTEVRVYSLQTPHWPIQTMAYWEPDFTPHGADLTSDGLFVMGVRHEWDLSYPGLRVASRTTPGLLLASAEYEWNAWGGDVAVRDSTVVVAVQPFGLYVSQFTAPATLGAPTPMPPGWVNRAQFLGPYLVTTGGSYYTAGAVTVQDFSDPANVQLVAEQTIPEGGGSFAALGSKLYVPLERGAVQVFDRGSGDQLEPTGRIRHPQDPLDIVLRYPHIYVADEFNYVLDWSAGDPIPPIAISSTAIYRGAKRLFLDDTDRMYSIANGAVQAIDVSDPTQPTLLGTIDGAGQEFDLAVWNSTVYVALAFSGFEIFDFTDPTDPVSLHHENAHSVEEVAVHGNRLYVYGNDGGGVLETFDVSDPSQPVLLSTRASAYGRNGLVLAQGLLFATGPVGTGIFSIGADGVPSLLQTIPAQEWCHAISAHGQRLAVGEGNFVRLYDVSDPSSPTELAYHEMPGPVYALESQDMFGLTVVLAGVRASGVHVIGNFDPTSSPLSRRTAIQHRAWPNPFRGTGIIGFELGWPDEVSLEIYDLAGRRVRQWQRSAQPGESIQIPWSGRDHAGRGVANGVYLYRVRSSRGEVSGSVILVR